MNFSIDAEVIIIVKMCPRDAEIYGVTFWKARGSCEQIWFISSRSARGGPRILFAQLITNSINPDNYLTIRSQSFGNVVDFNGLPKCPALISISTYSLWYLAIASKFICVNINGYYYVCFVIKTSQIDKFSALKGLEKL